MKRGSQPGATVFLTEELNAEVRNCSQGVTSHHHKVGPPAALPQREWALFS